MSEIVMEGALDMACFIAALRAFATQQPRPIISDPFANRLAAERGAVLREAYIQQGGEPLGIALRTAVQDEMILQIIKQEQIDTVINLASGMDSRPYRLQLPSELRWIEVDRPEVLVSKREKLADETAFCQVETFPLDINEVSARRDFLRNVCANAQNVFVITEGLLIYLSDEQVASLSKDLHAQPQIRCWLLDLASPVSLKHLLKWRHFISADLPMQFAPFEGSAFFTTRGWSVATYRADIAEAARLKLPMRRKWLVPFAVFLATHNALHNDGSILLKRASIDSDDTDTTTIDAKNTDDEDETDDN